MAFRDAIRRRPRGSGFELARALGYQIPEFRSHKSPAALPYRIPDPGEMTPTEKAALALRRAL